MSKKEFGDFFGSVKNIFCHYEAVVNLLQDLHNECFDNIRDISFNGDDDFVLCKKFL